MYDYSYEEDVLISLRMLKYLHDYNPDGLQRLMDFFATFEFDVDLFYRAAEYAIWEIFQDSESDYDRENEIETISFRHPELDRYYDLGRRWSIRHGCFSSAWQSKIKDVMEYFLMTPGYSVLDRKPLFTGDGVKIKLWLSPDSYEPIVFAASMLDLLVYLQQENERLEQELSMAEDEIREEAA